MEYPDSDFKSLVDTLVSKEFQKKSSKEKLVLDLMNVSKNRKLKLVSSPSIELINGYELSYYVTFSNTVVNTEKNKAVIYMGKATSRLSGITSIYFLKKENGKWKVFKRKALSIS